MFEWVFQALHISLPAAFRYTSSRMMLAASTALLITIFAGPWFIRRLIRWKIGQPIRKKECPTLGDLHAKKEDTPTMGGILILNAIVFSCILWLRWDVIFSWILVLGVLFFGAIGFLDDCFKLKRRSSNGLRGWAKLLCQFFFALGVSLYLLIPSVSNWLESSLTLTPPRIQDETQFPPEDLSLQEYAARVYVPFYKHPVYHLSAWVAALFFCLVIVGSSNGVNLTDGLDGLATGCLFFTALCLALFAFVSNHAGLCRYLQMVYVEGSGEIAVFCAALSGACLGFLWFNGYPAQVFMGDTGSLALGGGVGLAAVLLRREFLLALVGGVFVLEALSVIVQVIVFRCANERRVFLCAPLHHHFEYKGWHEVKVVNRFWIVAFLLTLLGLSSLKFQ